VLMQPESRGQANVRGCCCTDELQHMQSHTGCLTALHSSIGQRCGFVAFCLAANVCRRPERAAWSCCAPSFPNGTLIVVSGETCNESLGWYCCWRPAARVAFRDQLFPSKSTEKQTTRWAGQHLPECEGATPGAAARIDTALRVVAPAIGLPCCLATADMLCVCIPKLVLQMVLVG
jgi:hypothetical protein